MKILVTGSHGFVGTNLIDALSGEHEIIRWDARSDSPWPEVDVAIHLAGKVHDTKNVIHEEEYFKVNTELTKKIYDAPQQRSLFSLVQSKQRIMIHHMRKVRK